MIGLNCTGVKNKISQILRRTETEKIWCTDPTNGRYLVFLFEKETDENISNYVSINRQLEQRKPLSAPVTTAKFLKQEINEIVKLLGSETFSNSNQKLDNDIPDTVAEEKFYDSVQEISTDSKGPYQCRKVRICVKQNNRVGFKIFLKIYERYWSVWKLQSFIDLQSFELRQIAEILEQIDSYQQET